MNNLSSKARLVATIFDVLAWVVLGLGVVGAVIYFVAAISSGEFWSGLLVAGSVLIYSIVSWAGISLASVVAGYIEKKSA